VLCGLNCSASDKTFIDASDKLSLRGDLCIADAECKITAPETAVLLGLGKGVECEVCLRSYVCISIAFFVL
jgi:hypothetical protein